MGVALAAQGEAGFGRRNITTTAFAPLESSVPDEPNQNGVPRVLLADDGRETLALLHGILQYEGVDVVGVAAMHGRVIGDVSHLIDQTH